MAHPFTWSRKPYQKGQEIEEGTFVLDYIDPLLDVATRKMLLLK